MKMLADCPAIILEMEEDRLMKMIISEVEKRDSFIEGKLQRSKQCSFPCK
jgi:hypothetical protein